MQFTTTSDLLRSDVQLFVAFHPWVKSVVAPKVRFVSIIKPLLASAIRASLISISAMILAW
jgi:hypothetical protein